MLLEVESDWSVAGATGVAACLATMILSKSSLTMAQNENEASLEAVASAVTRGAFAFPRQSRANHVDAIRLGSQGVYGQDAHARRADLAEAHGTDLHGDGHVVPNHVANAQASVAEAGANRGAQLTHCDGGSCPVASAQAAARIRVRTGQLDCGLAANALL